MSISQNRITKSHLKRAGHQRDYGGSSLRDYARTFNDCVEGNLHRLANSTGSIKVNNRQNYIKAH